MSPYSAYPSLDALPIAERVDYLRRSCLLALERQQLTVETVQAALAEAVANEQYELAQGIEAAFQEWRQLPQLALF